MSEVKKIKFISPKGIANYPHLSEPDTKGQYADNKFKTKLVIPAKDAKQFVEFLKAEGAKHFGKKQHKLPAVKDENGNIVIIAKSKFKPGVFDSRNNPVTKDLKIGGGSTLRLGGVLFMYKDGVSLQLNQVQVIDLVEYGGGAGSSMFGADEEGGFEAEDEGEAQGGFGDEEQTDASEAPADDLDI